MIRKLSIAAALATALVGLPALAETTTTAPTATETKPAAAAPSLTRSKPAPTFSTWATPTCPV